MNHRYLMWMGACVLTNVECAFTGTHIYVCIYNIHTQCFVTSGKEEMIINNWQAFETKESTQWKYIQ